MDPKNPSKTSTEIQSQSGSALKNTLFIIAALVIIAALWSVYFNRKELPRVWKNVSLAAVSISSLFFPSENINVTTSSYIVENEQEFTLNFEHTGKRGGPGNYTLSYKCDNGLFLELIGENNVIQPIYCETLLEIASATSSSLKIIPTLGVENEISTTTITIAYKNENISDDESLIGSAEIVVVKNLNQETSTSEEPKNGAPVERVAGPKTEKLIKVGENSTTTIVTLPKIASDPNGFVDLAANIINIGLVDKVTNQYTATTSLKIGDRIAVRFEVVNVGTKTSNNWNFSASLPTLPWYIYQSDSQKQLSPGDRIEFTLGFDNIEKADNNVVLINVDPNNSINDTRRANNMASTTISGVKF